MNKGLWIAVGIVATGVVAEITYIAAKVRDIAKGVKINNEILNDIQKEQAADSSKIDAILTYEQVKDNKK